MVAVTTVLITIEEARDELTRLQRELPPLDLQPAG
jgi:hypothetical protein